MWTVGMAKILAGHYKLGLSYGFFAKHDGHFHLAKLKSS